MAIKNLSRNSKKQKASKEATENSPKEKYNGVIKLDTGDLKLPTQLIEEHSEKDTPFWQIEPVILVIFTLALTFIGFITALISRMPIKQ